MKRKIGSDQGHCIYAQRVGAVEPIFDTHAMDRFTLRGLKKGNGQWLLYRLAHNIDKLQRYAPQFVT